MDTGQHVRDEGTESTDLTSVLVGAEPHADSDVISFSLLIILFHHLELAGDVGEVLSQLTLSSLDDNLTGLDLYFHYNIISL